VSHSGPVIRKVIIMDGHHSDVTSEGNTAGVEAPPLHGDTCWLTLSVGTKMVRMASLLVMSCETVLRGEQRG
jgi:hypothetical protein